MIGATALEGREDGRPAMRMVESTTIRHTTRMCDRAADRGRAEAAKPAGRLTERRDLGATSAHTEYSAKSHDAPQPGAPRTPLE